MSGVGRDAMNRKTSLIIGGMDVAIESFSIWMKQKKMDAVNRVLGETYRIDLIGRPHTGALVKNFTSILHETDNGFDFARLS